MMMKLSAAAIEDAIEQWRDKKHAKKKNQCISRRTVHHIYSTLRTGLNYAKRKRIITANSCDNIEPVAKRRATISVLDASAAVNLMEQLKGDRLEYPVTLALFRGLRRGQLLALRWSDVDLERARMTVERSVELLDIHRIAFKGTKTGSTRIVALPQLAVAALKRHRAEQREYMMRHRDVYADEGLIFPWVDGSPWHPKRFSNWNNGSRQSVFATGSATVS